VNAVNPITIAAIDTLLRTETREILQLPLGKYRRYSAKSGTTLGCRLLPL